MKHILYLGVIAISFFMLQCSNSQKLLNDGNYDKSYKISLKELKKGKASTKDVEILNAALDKIYDENIETILESENGETLDDGVNAYNGYSNLEKKYKDAIKYLNVKNNERYTSVLSRRESLGNELYEDFKRAGIAALQISKENEDRGAGQEAYQNFEKAQQFNSTNEIADLLDEAYSNAVTIIVVETDAPYNGSYDYDIEREFKRVENIDSKFRKAFFEKHQNDADCIIKITFDQFDFQSNFRTYTRDYSREVNVERQVVNADGTTSIVVERETVYCTLNVDQTVLGLRLFADIRVIPQTDHCKSSRNNYQDFYEEPYEEYRVTGDRRALPDEFNRSSSGQRVRESDLVEIMVRKFYNDFALEYL